MKHLIYLSTLVSCALILAACATTKTTIIPQGNYTYTAITTGSKAADTTNAAIKKATKRCQQMRRNIIVTSHKTAYQGAMSRKFKEEIGTVTKITSAVTGSLIPGASSDSDYKTVIKFHCK